MKFVVLIVLMMGLVVMLRSHADAGIAQTWFDYKRAAQRNEASEKRKLADDMPTVKRPPPPPWCRVVWVTPHRSVLSDTRRVCVDGNDTNHRYPPPNSWTIWDVHCVSKWTNTLCYYIVHTNSALHSFWWYYFRVYFAHSCSGFSTTLIGAVRETLYAECISLSWFLFDLDIWQTAQVYIGAQDYKISSGPLLVIMLPYSV